MRRPPLNLLVQARLAQPKWLHPYRAKRLLKRYRLLGRLSQLRRLHQGPRQQRFIGWRTTLQSQLRRNPVPPRLQKQGKATWIVPPKFVSGEVFSGLVCPGTSEPN